MPETYQNILSLGDIRTRLAAKIKDWHQQTSNLSWPEHDNSLAEMDTHVLTLRAVKGNLAVVENKLPATEQRTLAAHFKESSLQDPEQFAPFVKAVKLALAA